MLLEKVRKILEKNKDCDEWAGYFYTIFSAYGIEKELDIAHFFAQINHESNDLSILEENLNYSEKRLLEVWPSKFKNLDTKKYANNPKELSRLIYNGFHGRGPIQLTWEENTKNFSFDVFGNDNVLRNPHLIVDNKAIGAHSACWFWKKKGLSKLALQDDIANITKILNGPRCLGLNFRKEKLVTYKQIFNI